MRLQLTRELQLVVGVSADPNCGVEVDFPIVGNQLKLAGLVLSHANGASGGMCVQRRWSSTHKSLQ